MFKKTLTLALLLLNLPAIADESQNSNRILLYVDDMAVTESQYRSFFASKGYTMPKESEAQKALQTRVVNELVNTLLMRREAEKRGLDKQPQTADALEIATNEVLSKALIEDFLHTIKINQAQIETAYQDILKEARRRAEYNLRHILVNDAKQAQQLLSKIQSKEDFEKLAQSASIDATATQGGYLGWVTSEVLETEIANALQTMNAGQLPTQAVRSQFGWHLLYIDEIKIQEVPPLTEISARLRELITQREIVKQVETLRKQAKIVKTKDKLERLPSVE